MWIRSTADVAIAVCTVAFAIKDLRKCTRRFSFWRTMLISFFTAASYSVFKCNLELGRILSILRCFYFIFAIVGIIRFSVVAEEYFRSAGESCLITLEGNTVGLSDWSAAEVARVLTSLWIIVQSLAILSSGIFSNVNSSCTTWRA